MRIHVLLSLLVLFLGFSSCSHHGHHSKKHHHHTFAKVDANQDGKISEKEWVDHQKEDFKKYDKNSDKSLSSDEYKSAGDCYHGCSCKMKNCDCSGKDCKGCMSGSGCESCMKEGECKNCQAKKCDGDSCKRKKKS